MINLLCLSKIVFLLGIAAAQGEEPKPGIRLFPKNGESIPLTTSTGIMTGVDVLADVRLVERQEKEWVVVLGGQLFRVDPDAVIPEREAAEYCRKKIAEATPPPEAWHTMLATVLLEQGDFTSGLTEVRRAVEMKSTFTNQRLLTQLLLKAEKNTEALAQIEAFSSRYGSNYFTVGNRASALAALGRDDDALKALEQAWDMATSPEQKSECLNLQARIKAKKGDFTGAKKDLEESLQTVPKNSLALNRMAWLCATCRDERFRDPALALSYAQELMKVPAAPSASYLDTYAAALAANGVFSKAQEQMRLAIKKLPAGSMQLDRFKERLALYEQGKPFVNK